MLRGMTIPRVFLSCLLASFVAGGTAQAAAASLMFVGTYTSGKSEGVYAFRLDDSGDTPKFESLGLAAKTSNPSFLAVDAGRSLLFAVNEDGSYQGEASGSVSSFKIDASTGRLTLLSQQSSRGLHPCHLQLDPSGRFLIAANYSSGSVAVFPVEPDGRLSPASDVVQQSGRGPNSARQEGPHAHCVTFDPAGHFVFICDLGLDQVQGFRLDASKGKLQPLTPPFASTKPGAGPRHLAFRPDGRFAYVLNELDSTVTVFAYDAASGKLTPKESHSTLPKDFSGNSTTAEIQVHPSGRWLYASNRGHDSLTQFAIDASTGALTYVATTKTGGRTPRHFALLPSGKHVLAANQASDTLCLFALEGKTGKLAELPTSLAAPAPVCVVFFTGSR